MTLTIDLQNQAEIKQAVTILNGLLDATETVQPTPVASVEDATPVATSPSPTPVAAATEEDETHDKTGVDADGLPWDARIHASSGQKLKKTSQWKKKRGVADALVAQVEAELRTSATPAAEPSTPVAASETPTPVVEETPQVQTPVATATPTTDEVMTFATLMKKVTLAVSAGEIADDALNNACVMLGLANFQALVMPANASLVQVAHDMVFA